MKKQIQHLSNATIAISKMFAVAVFTLSLSVAALANGEEKVNHWILEKFNSTYSDATETNWIVSDDFAKVSFVHEGRKVEAYFSHDGSFISENRTVSAADLPQQAVKTLKKRYSSFVVKDVIRYTTVDNVEFQASIESDKEIKLLKISSGGSIDILKSFKK